MITLDQLNPKLYPRECWINVYYYKSVDTRYHSHKIATLKEAEYFSKNKASKCKTLYRIHVRLK